MSISVNLTSFKQTIDEAQLHPYIKENFLTEDGYLKINLRDDKLFPMTDFLIKMRYYDILSFIYYIGGGKVFNQQLISYIMITQNVSPSRAKNIIDDELVYYNLVTKKRAWNNKLVILKTQTFQFFGNPKANQKYTIASMIKRSFYVEHHLKYNLIQRDLYNQYLSQEGVINEAQAKEMMLRKFLVTESITKSSTGKLHITFGFLNYHDSLNVAGIVNRIEYLNALLRVNETDIQFSINVCNYNAETTKLYKRKYERQQIQITAKYRNLVDVSFTNMNIKRYYANCTDKYEEDDNFE